MAPLIIEKKSSKHFPRIRIRIAGIYLKENKILLVKHRKNKREYFLLPGGGLEPGESMKEALIREWKEELNLSIKTGEFLFSGESVPPKNLRKSQVIQVVFRVISIKGSIKVQPDEALFDYKWVPIDDISQVDFFPVCQKQVMQYVQKKKIDRYVQYEWIL